MVANSEKTGTIDIMVFEGRNIIPMDDTGTSDPYLRIYDEAQGIETEKRTDIKSYTLNPKWNEKLSLKLLNYVTAKIRVVCMDFDRIGDDDYCGEVRIRINDLKLKKGQSVRKWFRLLGVESGEIELEITAVDFDYDPDYVFPPDDSIEPLEPSLTKKEESQAEEKPQEVEKPVISSPPKEISKENIEKSETPSPPKEVSKENLEQPTNQNPTTSSFVESDLVKEANEIIQKKDEHIKLLQKRLKEQDETYKNFSSIQEKLQQEIQQLQRKLNASKRAEEKLKANIENKNLKIEKWKNIVAENSKEIERLKDDIKSLREEIKLRENETLKLKTDSLKYHEIIKSFNECELKELWDLINQGDYSIDHKKDLLVQLKLCTLKIKSFPNTIDTLNKELKLHKSRMEEAATNERKIKEDLEAMKKYVELLKTENEFIRRELDVNTLKANGLQQQISFMRTGKRSPPSNPFAKKRISQTSKPQTKKFVSRKKLNESDDKYTELMYNVHKIQQARFAAVIIGHHLRELQRKTSSFSDQINSLCITADQKILDSLKEQRIELIKQVNTASEMCKAFFDETRSFADYMKYFNKFYETEEKTEQKPQEPQPIHDKDTILTRLTLGLPTWSPVQIKDSSAYESKKTSPKKVFKSLSKESIVTPKKNYRGKILSNLQQLYS